MELMKSSVEGAISATVAFVTSWTFAGYIVSNVAMFLIVKYYGLRDIIRGNLDPKVQ